MPVFQASIGFLPFRAVSSNHLEIDMDSAYQMTVATIFGTMWIILALFGQGGVWAYHSGNARRVRSEQVGDHAALEVKLGGRCARGRCVRKEKMAGT